MVFLLAFAVEADEIGRVRHYGIVTLVHRNDAVLALASLPLATG